MRLLPFAAAADRARLTLKCQELGRSALLVPRLRTAIAQGELLVNGIRHRRCRLPPASGCPTRLPRLLVGMAEVAQSLALAVPVAGLQGNRQRPLIAVDGVLKPPQPLICVAEIASLRALICISKGD